jgi:choline dehydrogenase-like flavoprotein
MAKSIASNAATAATAGTAWLSADELRVLEAICDTLIPALDVPAEQDPHGLMRRPAREMDVARLMAETLSTQDDTTRAEFRQLLGLLRGPTGGLLLSGRPRGFLSMTPEQRERALRAMASSNVAKLRQGFQALKRLALFIFYTAPAPDGGDNPNWPAIGFAAPPAPPSVPKPIRPLEITGDTTLDADVVVVGSGAGGGVVAGELAAAGKSVIVLEKGGYHNEADFSGREADMMPKLYLKQGLQATRDLSVSILAGSCLGGGTVVNWSTSFRTPDHVLGEWEREFGLTGFAGGELSRHFDTVEARMDINQQDGSPNANNAIIQRGCEKLGWSWGEMPRNANHCEQRCGACGYGCPYSRKQSTLITYLQDAADHGARFVVHASVDRVNLQGGAATGVTATVTDPATGARHRVMVRAKTVVLAAGSLHTPAILLRSGVSNPQVGRNLWLHPVVNIAGFYADPIRTWVGSLQTRYSNQFAHMEGDYGFTFEVAPGHPGLFGYSTPWESGRQHKEFMARAAHASALIVLVRDKHGGRVTLDKYGEPVVDYPLGEYERRMLTLGTKEGARLHLAAGARRVATLHSRQLLMDVPEGSDTAEPERVQAFFRGAERQGIQPNRVMLFSAHQMGTCRMAADARRGVIDNENRVFGVKGLYVADASTFPTASGVNPMLTILAIAHRAAQAIKAAG